MRVERVKPERSGGRRAPAYSEAMQLLRSEVGQIVGAIHEQGDPALEGFIKQFDTDQALALRVPPAELEGALNGLDSDVREGLELAIANVRTVAEAELAAESSPAVELADGQSVRSRSLAVSRVGVYAPGGRAAYPSSVVMCVTPAQVAGVAQIAVASPAGAGGRPHSVVMAACALCGIDEVYAMGGAHAIAALAYGTESVAAVDVIVGPGNGWVQEAKRQVYGQVGIDSLAGPSELVVVADDGADARELALDLAAQAEHGEESLVVAISDSSAMLDAIERETLAVAERSPSVSDARLVLIESGSVEQSIEISNELAPEHLELQVDGAEALVDRVTAAGCVFLGRGGATAFGDYVAGSNHVLPTAGAARFSGPLGVATFRRKQALVSLPVSAARALAPHVGSIARAEGFPVHAESAEVRAQDRNETP